MHCWLISRYSVPECNHHPQEWTDGGLISSSQVKSHRKIYFMEEANCKLYRFTRHIGCPMIPQGDYMTCIKGAYDCELELR